MRCHLITLLAVYITVALFTKQVHSGFLDSAFDSAKNWIPGKKDDPVKTVPASTTEPKQQTSKVTRKPMRPTTTLRLQQVKSGRRVTNILARTTRSKPSGRGKSTRSTRGTTTLPPLKIKNATKIPSSVRRMTATPFAPRTTKGTTRIPPAVSGINAKTSPTKGNVNKQKVVMGRTKNTTSAVDRTKTASKVKSDIASVNTKVNRHKWTTIPTGGRKMDWQSSVKSKGSTRLAEKRTTAMKSEVIKKGTTSRTTRSLTAPVRGSVTAPSAVHVIGNTPGNPSDIHKDTNVVQFTMPTVPITSTTTSSTSTTTTSTTTTTTSTTTTTTSTTTTTTSNTTTITSTTTTTTSNTTTTASTTTTTTPTTTTTTLTTTTTTSTTTTTTSTTTTTTVHVHPTTTDKPTLHHIALDVPEPTNLLVINAESTEPIVQQQSIPPRETTTPLRLPPQKTTTFRWTPPPKMITGPPFPPQKTTKFRWTPPIPPFPTQKTTTLRLTLTPIPPFPPQKTTKFRRTLPPKITLPPRPSTRRTTFPHPILPPLEEDTTPPPIFPPFNIPIIPLSTRTPMTLPTVRTTPTSSTARIKPKTPIPWAKTPTRAKPTKKMISTKATPIWRPPSTSTTTETVVPKPTKPPAPKIHELRPNVPPNTGQLPYGEEKHAKGPTKRNTGSVIAVVVIGLMLGLASVFAGLFFMFQMKRNKQKQTLQQQQPSASGEQRTNESGASIDSCAFSPRGRIPQSSMSDSEWAPDIIQPGQFAYKGPLKIPFKQPLILQHELESDKPQSLHEGDHIQFDDTLNEVHEMGSEVEVIVFGERQKKSTQDKRGGAAQKALESDHKRPPVHKRNHNAKNPQNAIRD